MLFISYSMRFIDDNRHVNDNYRLQMFNAFMTHAN